MTVITAAGSALAGNPFFKPYNTPYQTIPFNELKNRMERENYSQVIFFSTSILVWHLIFSS